MATDFDDIRHAFNQVNIPLIPLKGVVLANSYYPSPTMRYFDDLDMLIPGSMSEEALTLLQQLGYQPHPNAPAPEWHHLPPYVHPRHGTLVELHLDLLRRTNPGWELATIWDRLETREIAGQLTPILSPADALLHTVLHGRHNLFHRLTTFIDIGYLSQAVAAAGQLDLLTSLAMETGSIQTLGYSLYELERLFGWRPFGEQQRRLALTTRQRQRFMKLVGWQTLDLQGRPEHDGPLARLHEARLTDNWRQTGYYLRQLLLPPAEFVQQTYGAENNAGGLDYGRRLWRRARVAWQQFWARANQSHQRQARPLKQL